MGPRRGLGLFWWAVRGRLTRPRRSLGRLLLAAWLVLYGVLTAPFLKVGFAHSGDLLAGLAVVAGVFLLLDR